MKMKMKEIIEEFYQKNRPTAAAGRFGHQGHTLPSQEEVAKQYADVDASPSADWRRALSPVWQELLFGGIFGCCAVAFAALTLLWPADILSQTSVVVIYYVAAVLRSKATLCRGTRILQDPAVPDWSLAKLEARFPSKSRVSGLQRTAIAVIGIGGFLTGLLDGVWTPFLGVAIVGLLSAVVAFLEYSHHYQLRYGATVLHDVAKKYDME